MVLIIIFGIWELNSGCLWGFLVVLKNKVFGFVGVGREGMIGEFEDVVFSYYLVLFLLEMLGYSNVLVFGYYMVIFFLGKEKDRDLSF